MAIQNRRGSYKDLDPDKLLPGEYAIVLQDDPHCSDGRAAYVCFEPGNVKRIATYEDMIESVKNATGEISQLFTLDIVAAIKAAKDAGLGITMVYDPSDGLEEPIQDALEHMWREMIIMAGNPLTAGEYDAKNLTAAEYDAKNLTARDYDIKGKTLV